MQSVHRNRLNEPFEDLREQGSHWRRKVPASARDAGPSFICRNRLQTVQAIRRRNPVC